MKSVFHYCMRWYVLKFDQNHFFNIMKITQLTVIQGSGIFFFFNIIFGNYCRLYILIYLLIRLALPILISQQVKIISDLVLPTSGIFEGSSKSSKSSLLIHMGLLVFLSKPSLLYINTVQW